MKKILITLSCLLLSQLSLATEAEIIAAAQAKIAEMEQRLAPVKQELSALRSRVWEKEREIQELSDFIAGQKSLIAQQEKIIRAREEAEQAAADEALRLEQKLGRAPVTGMFLAGIKSYQNQSRTAWSVLQTETIQTIEDFLNPKYEARSSDPSIHKYVLRKGIPESPVLPKLLIIKQVMSTQGLCWALSKL